MDTQGNNYPDHQLLNYSELRRRFSEAHSTYVAAAPFPHFVLDDFVDAGLIDEVLKNFPAPDADIYLPGSDKSDAAPFLTDIFKLSPLLRQLIWELNSGTFIRILEAMTGIDDLIPDPTFSGGCVQQSSAGYRTEIRAPETINARTNLECRVQLELFLNKNWLDEYQGHLELWNSDLSSAIIRLRPRAGRCVIFSTRSTSYHGQPQKLACPGGTTRKSIKLCYYSLGHIGAQTLSNSDLPPPQ